MHYDIFIKYHIPRMTMDQSCTYFYVKNKNEGNFYQVLRKLFLSLNPRSRMGQQKKI